MLRSRSRHRGLPRSLNPKLNIGDQTPMTGADTEPDTETGAQHRNLQIYRFNMILINSLKPCLERVVRGLTVSEGLCTWSKDRINKRSLAGVETEQGRQHRGESSVGAAWRKDLLSSTREGPLEHQKLECGGVNRQPIPRYISINTTQYFV